MKRVLVIGATGRVGGAVASSLLKHAADVEVLVAGRRRAVGEAFAQSLGPRARFVPVDLDDRASMLSAMRGADLVINTAGPFQMAEPRVLDASIEAGVHYADVCDDIGFSKRAKQLHARALEKGVAAITTGGVFPGLSNVMAGEMIERGSGAKQVDFRYHVAGTGGAGPTVMSTTFLICSEPAIEFVNGKAVPRRAFSGRKMGEFLAPLGQKACYFFELPEATSIFETYQVPNVAARFGTSPDFWNLATSATALLAPRGFLRDTAKVAGYVKLITPMLKKIDEIVGADLAMQITVVGNDGKTRSMNYRHPDTVIATGLGVAMQALEILEGRVRPGVWWPGQAIENKMAYIARAVVGASFVDSEPQGRSGLSANVALASVVIEQARAMVKKRKGGAGAHPAE